MIAKPRVRNYLCFCSREAALPVVVGKKHLQLQRHGSVVASDDGVFADAVLGADVLQWQPPVHILPLHHHLVPPLLGFRGGRSLKPATRRVTD
jgi:hypothetical protein